MPTTCTQTSDDIGCCVGNVLYYCSTTKVKTLDCASEGAVCGWAGAAQDGYACVDPPATSDPSGTYPLVCP